VIKKKVEQDVRFIYILMNADWGLSNSPTAFDKIHYALIHCPIYRVKIRWTPLKKSELLRGRFEPGVCEPPALRASPFLKGGIKGG
jgi:hypothetical protein